MKTLTPLKRTKKLLGLLIALLLACFALSQRAQAVVPPPDGGYPGFNTAEGQNALFSLTTGAANTAVGWFSLFSDAEGSFNTATGVGALLFNTANNNTALGAAALLNNTDGFNNTAVGAAALLNNTTGSSHTAVGFQALQHNTAPCILAPGGFGSNTAVGDNALATNTCGAGNTAVGSFALVSNDTGNSNTAIGAAAGTGITTGNNIITIGSVSGVSTVGGEVDNSCYIDNIFDGTIDFGTALIVGVDQDGKLGTQALPSQGGQQLSLNDLLEQQKKVQNLEATVAALTAQLKEQAMQIQKVSAQLEPSRTAPQVVNNP